MGGADPTPDGGAGGGSVLSLVDAFNLAVRAYGVGDRGAATTLCDSILRAIPQHADTLHLLGLIRLAEGDPAAAAARIGEALRGKQTPTMLANHAAALSMLGRPQAATTALQTAVALEPDNAGWFYNLGVTQQISGRTGEAPGALGRAARIAPDHAATHEARGRALFALNRPVEAAAAFRAALTSDPTRIEAITGLGVALTHAGHPDPAYEQHRRAGLLDPRRLEDAVHALDHDRASLRFDRLEDSRDRLAEALRSNGAQADWRLLASILYRDLYRPLPADLRLHARTLLDARLAAFAPARPTTFARPISAHDDRLRVGYLSAHLKNHPIGQVTLSAFAAHDRRRVEVHGLLRGGVDPARDYYAARHRQGFDRTHDLSALPPDAAAAHIAALGLDVLVYLDGYMDKEGLEILARRPAPTRVYWLGHAGGIGTSCADYMLADRIVVPPGEEGLYAEKVVRLPDCYHCADRHPLAPEPPSRASQGLPDDAVVFCGFNNVEKIDAAAFAAWMEILRRVERSVLWLSGSERPATNLRRFAAEQGVDPARVVFAGRIADKGLHLARYRLADVFLDTWTMNASTTALDALWAGLPLVARTGDCFSNRISSSMLTAVGMGELICPDVPAYIALAEALARNPQLRASLRARLIADLQTRPLFDIDRFARKLEGAYFHMRERARAGLPPQSFEVAEA